MTGNKVWRLSTAIIIMFGWIFLTPAQADDPISIAQSKISDLKLKVKDLADQTKTLELISIAESKYNDALVARDARIANQLVYDNVLQAEATALDIKNIAQSLVDNQTTTVNNTLITSDNTKTILDLAIISLQAQQALINATQFSPSGITYDVYNCWSIYNIYNNAPPMGCNSSPVYTSVSSNIDAMWGNGGPTGTVGDDYQVHWYGFIKGTAHWTPQFRICSDDGGRIYINGQLIVNDWWDRGFSCANTYGYYMSSDALLPIDVWFYENGGGAGVQLQWNIGNGWQVVPIDRFSTTNQSASQSDLTLLTQLTLERDLAQNNYDAALATYNLENQILQGMIADLNTKVIEYNLAKLNSVAALDAKNIVELNYQTKISEMNNAVDDAWNSYDTQFKFEETQRMAIANALANQPQPTVDPSPVLTPTPTPAPTPEKTLPVETTPSPTPQITDVVTPTPEPSPKPTIKPSPQPTDTNQASNPEPTSSPSSNQDKTQNTPVSDEAATMIADLSNSNTLNELTPDQKIEVSKILGVDVNELLKISEISKTNPTIAQALEEFGDRANANLNAPMPYTLADATTEIAAEKLLSDPLSVFTSIDLQKVLSPTEWGKDMTNDQREKVQEIVIPVIIASNIVSVAMTRRV